MKENQSVLFVIAAVYLRQKCYHQTIWVVAKPSGGAECVAGWGQIPVIVQRQETVWFDEIKFDGQNSLQSKSVQLLPTLCPAKVFQV